MPTFKGKDGKPRFSMNPQIGKSMYGDGSAPGMDALGGSNDAAAPGAGAGDGDSDDQVEVHHGGNPEGEPAMHEGTAYHTIHMDSMGQPTEIRNHDDIEGAVSHVKECMGEAEHDDGDSDVAPQSGDSAVFE